VVPSAATGDGGHPILGLLARACGGAVALAALPFCFLENHGLRRPSLGVIAAQKPRGPGAA
jgi:hypothetical protein